MAYFIYLISSIWFEAVYKTEHSMLKGQSRAKTILKEVNEPALQMTSFKSLWLGLNLAEFYDRQAKWENTQITLFSLSWVWILRRHLLQRHLVAPWPASSWYRFAVDNKCWLTGPPQPGPRGKDGGETSSHSLGTTSLLRTRSNVLSFALLCLNTGAVWCCREGLASRSSRFSLENSKGFQWAIDWCWIAVRNEFSLCSGLLPVKAMLLPDFGSRLCWEKEAPNILHGRTWPYTLPRRPRLSPHKHWLKSPWRTLNLLHHFGTWLRYLNSVPVRWEKLPLFWKIGKILII